MNVGIIGGGQLGMYLAINAYKLGHKVFVYDSNSDCCAKDVVSNFVNGSFDDIKLLEEFCEKCDVVTYEFENINSDIVEELSKKYNVVQKSHPLKLASSRINERNLALKLGINQPKFEVVESLDNIGLEYPYIIKSVSMGYDGKHQYHINNKSDLYNLSISESIAEEKIDFDYEISVIVCRNTKGETVFYEPFYNIHRNGILHITKVNYPIKETVKEKAYEIVLKIIESENIYGILCCEFFVKNEDVYFNELAPRPHNSGHITMDTHEYNQFENHILAITGNKLGSNKCNSTAFMVNVLGQDRSKVEKILELHGDSVKFYDYHKEARENRKVGHLVVYDESLYNEFINNW